MRKWLNYNNLYYFWIIAKEGGITPAAKRLRLSVSNLSGQLRALEEHMGHEFFSREGRHLELTEAGKVALDYAHTIFSSGEELFDVLAHQQSSKKRRTLIRIGALNSMSKNLQYVFIKNVLEEENIQLRVTEGSLSELADGLVHHRLDLVLSNMPVRSDQDKDLFNQRVAELPIYLVGQRRFKLPAAAWPQALNDLPCFVPTLETRVRNNWEHYCEQHRVRPEILAEVEDMALLRVLALSGQGCSVVPQVVVRDEIKSKKLHVLHTFKGITEIIYAITPRRVRPNEVVERTVKAFTKELKDLKLIDIP